MKLGQALKNARQKTRYKQVEAADIIGISQTYLSQIEKDKKEPSIDVIHRMCAAYKVPLPILTWQTLEIKDIQKNKRRVFTELKPIIDGLIDQFFQ